MKKLIVVLAFLVVAVGCSERQPEMIVISGEAGYRERIMLPPNATVEVALSDVSRADVAAPVIVASSFTPQGGPPFEFELTVPSSEIDERMSYSLSAKVTVVGELLFITTSAYDPFREGVSGIMLEMQAIARSSGESTAVAEPLKLPEIVSESPHSTLVDGQWRLTELSGYEIPDLAQNHPVLNFDEATSMMSGPAGCNQLTSQFETEGNRLSFAVGAMTKRYCDDADAFEQSYLDALLKVRYYGIFESTLELYDEQRRRLASFELVE